MQTIAEAIAHYLSNAVEIVAAIVIGIGLLRVIYEYAQLLTKHSEYTHERIRVRFGSAVAVALELLLGADVLATAVAPTWDEIGKLAAIAALRTALNYFLEQELSRMEERSGIQAVKH